MCQSEKLWHLALQPSCGRWVNKARWRMWKWKTLPVPTPFSSLSLRGWYPFPASWEYDCRLLRAFATQHTILQTESYWIQEKEETMDLKTACHEQNLLNLCCCWHLWWLKEEQKEKILFPCHSSCSLCPSGFFLSLDSGDSFSSCVLIINFPVVLLSPFFKPQTTGRYWLHS